MLKPSVGSNLARECLVLEQENKQEICYASPRARSKR